MAKSSRAISDQAHYLSGLAFFSPLCLLFCTLLSMITLPIPLFSTVSPAFMVMAIFYLTQWQPNFLPFWAVFLCGLCYDILQSSLFGSHALMLLTFRLALGHLRQKTGFIPSATKSWMLFIPVAIGYFVFEWLFISFQANDYRIPAHLLQRDLISLLLYPLVHIGLSSIIIRIQSSR